MGRKPEAERQRRLPGGGGAAVPEAGQGQPPAEQGALPSDGRGGGGEERGGRALSPTAWGFGELTD